MQVIERVWEGQRVRVPVWHMYVVAVLLVAVVVFWGFLGYLAVVCDGLRGAGAAVLFGAWPLWCVVSLPVLVRRWVDSCVV
jgi:hypothetical protein